MKVLWTPEQAREMAKRGNEAKAKRKAELREAVILHQAVADLDYTGKIKARMRAQVELTMTRIDEELSRGNKVDGAKLDRLASALERLAELERVLDGRPTPGSRKPPREDAPSSKAAPASRPTPTPARPATQAPTNPPPAAPATPTSSPQPPLLSEPPDF